MPSAPTRKTGSRRKPHQAPTNLFEMSPPNAALAWAVAGFPVFPCSATGYDRDRNKWAKRPHGMLNQLGAERGEGGWKLATRSVVQITAWWKEDPEALIGVPPGMVGAVVLDCDGEAGVEAVVELAGRDFYDLNQTLCVETPGGGLHVWFDRRGMSGERRIGNGHLKDIPGEARGDRGYVIVPPSVMPDDRAYKVVGNELVLDQLPEWAAWTLPWERPGSPQRAMLGDITTADEQAWVESHSRDYHDPAGKAEVEAAKTAIQIAARDHPGDAHLGRHPTATREVARLLTLVQRGDIKLNVAEALATLREALVASKPKGGPDLDRFISDAIALRAGEDRDRQFAPNLRLVSGDEADELERRIEQRATEHRLLGDPTTRQPAPFEVLVQQRLLFRRADREAVRILSEEDATEATGDLDFTQLGMGLDSFLAVDYPPVEWRIQDLWSLGSRVLIAAEAKTGKTTMAMHLMKVLADGGSFLGRFPATQLSAGTIGFANLEMNELQLQQWFDAQGIRNGDRISVFNLKGKSHVFDVRHRSIREKLVAMLRQFDVKVLIIDTLASLTDGLEADENAASEVGFILSGFDALIEEAELDDLVLIHHFGHFGERARGSSKLLAWPDALWEYLLDKNAQDDDTSGYANNRYLRVIGRDVHLPESRVEFDPATKQIVMGATANGRHTDRSRRDEHELMRLVGAAIERDPGGSLRSLREALPFSHKRVDQAIKALVAIGAVTVIDGPRGASQHHVEPGWVAAGRPVTGWSRWASSPASGVAAAVPTIGPTTAPTVPSVPASTGAQWGTVGGQTTVPTVPQRAQAQSGTDDRAHRAPPPSTVPSTSVPPPKRGGTELVQGRGPGRSIESEVINAEVDPESFESAADRARIEAGQKHAELAMEKATQDSARCPTCGKLMLTAPGEEGPIVRCLEHGEPSPPTD